MEPEAKCYQCSFRVSKDVRFDGPGSEEQQIIDAFSGVVENHVPAHEGEFVIRVGWQSGGTYYETTFK